MSKIAPSLLYLAIYNPTLKPLLLDPDNEDAEEQAHILFYTAREHAVSRDRILRQVGLAKALVSFSEMFGAALPCENVHSHARRMIMFSPEPDFWIHACYELAKTPRPQPVATKAKPKGKEQEHPSRPATLYDYHDNSVHDTALRAHFQRGYEEFRLLHGSFKSVLSGLGQHALELQLERFFTIWAWKWDIEDDNFGIHLGLPLHPLHTKLTPALDNFSSTLPGEVSLVFALMSHYVIPPRTPRYPAALVRYILTRIPPPALVPLEQPIIPSTSNPIPTRSDQMQKSFPSNEAPKSATQTPSSFPLPLSMPTMTMPSMNFGLDMKNVKWGWLTFGKGGTAKATTSTNQPNPPTTSLAAMMEPPKEPSRDSPVPVNGELRPSHPEVDTLDVDSLLEAMTVESVGSHTRAASPALSTASCNSRKGRNAQDETNTKDDITPFEPSSQLKRKEDGDDMNDTQVKATPPPPTTPIPSFLSATVHLSYPHEPTTTQRKRVLHLSKGAITMVIVVEPDHMIDMSRLAGETVVLMDSMQSIIADESRAKDQQIPSAAKILQPKDKYIISIDEYTVVSSTGFMSRSEQLYHEQDLLHSALDIQEVFSRGQNPQHWHVGKRGLPVTSDGRSLEGEVFMEVARKETTLTDVDNELVGVVKRFTEQV